MKLNTFYKSFIVIELVSLTFSCDNKKNYVCSCREHYIGSKEIKIVSTEIINDTKENAEKKCSEKWCGDECGCSLEN